MRKTKNIYQAFKTLLLVFGICFLVSTQSTAQSNLDDYYTPQSTEMNKHITVQTHTTWNFFDWIRSMLYTEIRAPEETTTDTQQNYEKRTRIVTTDMSIREGNKEE